MKRNKNLYMFVFFVIFSVILLSGCEKTTKTNCPTINTPEKFFPVKSGDTYELKITEIRVGDGYEIAPTEKQMSPFFTDSVSCEKGSEAGKNINYIYCDQLVLLKLITNDEGDIIEEKEVGVSFVFNSDLKLIETKCYE